MRLLFSTVIVILVNTLQWTAWLIKCYYKLRDGEQLVVDVNEFQAYSAMHRFWSVELAELADGPAGCDEVATGWCLFAWNFSVTRSTVVWEVVSGLLTKHDAIFTLRTRSYRLKIPPVKNHVLPHISASSSALFTAGRRSALGAEGGVLENL